MKANPSDIFLPLARARAKWGRIAGLISGSLVLAASASISQAQIMMFDFGPTTVGADYYTFSPGHASGAISSGLTSWNKVGVADVSSGLLYAGGTSATGISIRSGVENSATSDTLDFTLDPNNGTGLTGTAMTGGIYAGTSPARDGIFHNSGSLEWAVGAQVSGLAAGTYQVYLSGRNTNFGNPYAQNFYAAAGAAGDTFDFSSLAASAVTNTGTSASPPSTWVAGATYAMFTITLAEGEVLNIATEGVGTGNDGRGFLNSLQIVAVPEPGTAALLVCGGLVILQRGRRRGKLLQTQRMRPAAENL